ncbi:MAG: hypothetical protein Q9P44_14350 [Anaerolineae bacterium]|nr:hypothetical protein [Anaerolineae bacterium]
MTLLRKIALYALPFALPFLLLTGALTYIGESLPLSEVLRLQAGDTPVLYRVRYGNRDQRYKRMAVDYFQPDVMMIGSSRVLQFRSDFMNLNPDAFYNAAAPAWQLGEISRLLFTMNHRPDMIILGIDDAWFNADYGGDPIVQPPTSDFDRFFIVNRTVIQEILDGETLDLRKLLSREEPGGSGGLALGSRAIIDGHGFRNDGSEQYGDFLVAQHLWQPNMRGLHIGWFEEGAEMYVRGDVVDDEAMQQLRAILDFAQENDILVIGLYPPYMPSLWQRLENSADHSYLRDATIEVESLFAEYDFPYFDFHNGAAVGATDEDFFDGWHSSERIAAQMFINIAREVPQLEQYSDLDALQEIVNTASDTFGVFPFTAQ